LLKGLVIVSDNSIELEKHDRSELLLPEDAGADADIFLRRGKCLKLGGVES
jgi:hypothetical protein